MTDLGPATSAAQGTAGAPSESPLLEYSLALGYIPAMPLTYPFQLPSTPAILVGLDPNTTTSPKLPGPLSPKSLFMHYDQLMLHGVAALNATLADRPALQVTPIRSEWVCGSFKCSELAFLYLSRCLLFRTWKPVFRDKCRVA